MSEPTAEQVDAAVRSALAALRGGLRGRPGRGPDRSTTFAGPLLGLSQAEGFPESAAEVRVRPGTVVTPMALDLLKRRGIRLRWASAREVGTDRDPGEWGFAIEEDSGWAHALRRSLLEGAESWIEVGPKAEDAASWVVGGPARGAVVLTIEGSVAAWVANQVPGVRGATVADPDAADRAARSLGANLLVVEPAGKPIPWVRQIVATFRRAGAPMPPAWLNGGLDHHEDRRSDRSGHALAAASVAGRPGGPLPDRPAHARGGPDGWLDRSR